MESEIVVHIFTETIPDQAVALGGQTGSESTKCRTSAEQGKMDSVYTLVMLIAQIQ